MLKKNEKLDEIADLLENSLYDSESTTSEKYAKGLLRAHAQIVFRNALLTTLLKNYIDTTQNRNRENTILKRILFGVFLAILIILTATLAFVFIRVDLNEVTVPLVVSLLSVGATYLGSIFAIYEIIFRYLFPTDEEKDTISMIQTVITNDLKVEEFVSKLGESDQDK